MIPSCSSVCDGAVIEMMSAVLLSLWLALMGVHRCTQRCWRGAAFGSGTFRPALCQAQKSILCVLQIWLAYRITEGNYRLS